MGFHSGFVIYGYTTDIEIVVQPSNQVITRKDKMKLKLKPTPTVEMELQSTQDELRLLRKALGRFCTKDFVRVGMTDEEQAVFRKFHSDLSEIDTVVGK